MTTAKQTYRDGLDQIDQAGLDPDTALRWHLKLICDLYVAEGGTRDEYLDLLTHTERWTT